MTNAPERIWFNGSVIENHKHVSTVQFPGGVEYIRAELPAEAPIEAPDWEGFGRAIMDYGWPTTVSIEDADIFDLALEYQLIRKIPGGYDPERHNDAHGTCPEPGDDWYEHNFSGETREADQ